MINWDNIDQDYKIFEDPIHGYIKINSKNKKSKTII
jgi:hypothetical protein